ncbi:MAG: hypothetical protein KDA51_13145 [Planctomycetales bacterium]|nr:hypothetical protein [Planctomycetales bacterium]MCA9182403.1 hypothetical protein [Planctomycetales bacterium]
MMRILNLLCTFLFVVTSLTAHAAVVIQVDIDGLDDGVLTYSPNFSFGGDTTSASQSAASTAVGLTGGDSIFGGNGVVSPDTYVYSYTPGTDGNNYTPAAGTALNNDGDVSTGVLAGGTAVYNVYATWPFSSNVSGGLTSYTLTDGASNLFSVSVDQVNTGNEWVFLGAATLDQSKTYQLIQQAGANTFVSMRAAGVLFDAKAVPEPSGFLVAVLGGTILMVRRRRA